MTTTDNQDCFDFFFKERERKKKDGRGITQGETACMG